MANIDATPFIQVAAPRGHRRKFGKKARVTLPGATVDESTHKQIKAWMRASGRSRGLVLDEVVAYARGERFTPTKQPK